MNVRGTVLFGLTLASLVAAVPHAGAALRWAWWSAGALATGLALWLLLLAGAVRLYTLGLGEDPPACACTRGWTPLDARWKRLRKAVGRGLDEPTPLALSASAAALGQLAAWFLGRERARAPLDEAWRALAAANYAQHGCVRGRESLVPVARAPRNGVPPGDIALLCPTWVARNPRRFVRVWADEPP